LNIAPREMDEALLTPPAVSDTTALGIPNRQYGQKIMACALLLSLLACGGGGGSSGGNGGDIITAGITATGPGVLSVSPLDTSTLIWATPLGSLAPPGHVLPTDHVYLMFVDPVRVRLVQPCAAYLDRRHHLPRRRPCHSQRCPRPGYGEHIERPGGISGIATLGANRRGLDAGADARG